MKGASGCGLLSSSSCGSNSKREQRLERKKRKILALAEVMQLNEQDLGKVSFTVDRETVLELNQNSEPESQQPEQKKQKLTGATYCALKTEIKQKRDRMRNIPKLRLKEVGEEALMKTIAEDRVPLLLDDIQALLMHALLRTDSPMNPSRWAVLEKSAKLTHTTVLVVEGLTSDDFTIHEQDLKECKKIFHNILQVVCPSDRLVEELACVPLSDTHKDILVAEYGSLEAAMLACKDHLLIRKSIFSNIDSGGDETNQGELDYSNMDLAPGDNFPRTQMLLSPIQMVNEDYPLPLTGSLQHRYAGYITTNDHYDPVTPRSPMFGLDCEMCKTSIGASELTRVSIIDEQGNEFYETLVRPSNKIVDYLTQFSGITPEIMKNVSKTLEDVHKDLKNKLPPDAILVGQSLNFDFNAMKIMHPYVIDTSILFNMTGTPGTKSKLKVLAKKFLQRDIQCSSKGHNSIEDCSAALELVKLKLTKNIYFGDQCLQDRRNYHKKLSRGGIATKEEIQRIGTDVNGTDITGSLFEHTKKKNKKSTIVTNANNLDSFENYFGDAIKANSEVKKMLSFNKLKSEEAVIDHTVEKCLNYDFNLACIQLKRENLIDADMKRAKFEEIDGWIRKLYAAISVNGMLVVLLAGGKVNPSSRMAVAMIQTKKG
ncbi:RNA exonuclease 5 [Topomyia yanbarensis]|uniref:RNA exonuclease 5 n=1 Tax=Topomyia yanbarensis TaxID=2498891 RepID=UPI00273C5F79|nr:RNA exonuclease 5 [Topomyia yanbarensis]XP_058832774.1 RNA exonuclease 5 [Topomyia yanbarensis]XP_058832775.1 RNA exonuclease 5 [Topomyia yanbarensis]